MVVRSFLRSGQAFDLALSWMASLCSIRQTVGPVLRILVKMPLSPSCRVSVSENKLQNKVTKTANSIETRYPPATVVSAVLDGSLGVDFSDSSVWI